jgi:hypothetical protein
MKWLRGLAAAVVVMLGVFVAAIPPTSVEARAHAAPLATDDDSDVLAQEEQQQEADEQAQQQLQDSLQQMEQSEQQAEQQNEAAQQQVQLDEQLASMP